MSRFLIQRLKTHEAGQKHHREQECCSLSTPLSSPSVRRGVCASRVAAVPSEAGGAWGVPSNGECWHPPCESPGAARPPPPHRRCHKMAAAAPDCASRRAPRRHAKWPPGAVQDYSSQHAAHREEGGGKDYESRCAARRPPADAVAGSPPAAAASGGEGAEPAGARRWRK